MEQIVKNQRGDVMFGKPKDFSTAGTLVDGLPVPSNTMITVHVKPEGLHFQALTGRKKEDWPTYELPIDKVENLQLMNQSEIKQIVEQSVPGLIIGGAALGALGAMVGGRVHTKEKVTNHTILVINYISGEQKQIILDVTAAQKESEQVLNYFKKLKPIHTGPIQL